MRIHALDVGEDAGAVLAGDGPELEILLHRHGGEGAAALRYMGDAEPDDALGGAVVQRLAVELDAAGRAHHVADRAQRGGLAGAVGAQQRGQRALVEGEGQAMERLDLTVVGAQVLDVEQCRHWSLLPR